VSGAAGAVDGKVGRTVGGKYRLVRLIGSGGMGQVYEAQHAGIGRRFAVKLLHQLLADDREVVARFQREAQTAGGLENENIVAVLDSGTAEDGIPFIVMEYLEGEDLARLLVRSGPLSVPRATYVAIQACRGLAAAHARDIVHRDLKPENLFICRRNDGSDQVKLLDFGIAKFHAGSNLTQTGTTMGTPFYMSAEQARGAKEVDLRSDIYSMGVILYEMLTGAKAHPGDSYNAILYHVLTQEPRPLDEIRPDLPAGLAGVVGKAMAREAEDRYPSAADFISALVPFAGRVVTPSRSQVGLAPVGSETMSSPASLPALPASVATGTATARSGRRRVLLWGALAAFMIALAGTAILWLSLKQEPEQAGVPKPSGPPPTMHPSPPPSTAHPSPPPAPSAVAPPPLPAEPPAPPVTGTGGRRPGRAAGERRAKHAGQAVAKTPKTEAGAPARADGTAEDPSSRKLIRTIDRKNPFEE
jgi:serine/threonine protein kinase